MFFWKEVNILLKTGAEPSELLKFPNFGSLMKNFISQGLGKIQKLSRLVFLEICLIRGLG